jgi:hypothetical protein
VAYGGNLTQGLSSDELSWAAGVLLDAALHPRLDNYAISSSIYPWGADRSAAAALPALLLPTFTPEVLDREQLQEGLTICATSQFDEVPRVLATGLAPIWIAPCDADEERRGRCRHEIAWHAVEVGARNCQFGEWDEQTGSRSIEPLTGSAIKHLPNVPADRLHVNRLTGPIVAAADAAQSNCCVAESAKGLLPVLLAAHRRSTVHWADKRYRRSDKDQRLVARVLLAAAAADDDSSLLAEHVSALTTHAAALSHLLRDLMVLCTYDQGLRQALPAIWPPLMHATLDAIEAGSGPRASRRGHHSSSEAIANLIPHPSFDVADLEIDASLSTASRDWIDPEALADLRLRWATIVAGQPASVDALIGLIGTAAASWQASTGLRWVEELIGDDYDAVARHSWLLPGWLERLRVTGTLAGDDVVLFQRIVDGLVSHGDTRAVSLQRAAE